MSLAFSSAKLVDGTGISIVTCVLTASGSYVTGGDTFPDLATLPGIGLFKNEKIVALDIYGQSSVFSYQWVPGATSATHKMKCSTASAEVAAGAYPGGITGETFKIVLTLSTAPR